MGKLPNPLYEQQKELESLSQSMALEQFWERHEGVVSDIGAAFGIKKRAKQGISHVEPGKQFIREKVELVAKRIEDELAAVNRGEGGSAGANLNPFLYAMSMKGIAYLALKEVIDRGCEKIKENGTVLFQYDLIMNAIGRNVALELQAWKQKYSADALPAVEKLSKEIKAASDSAERKKLTAQKRHLLERLAKADFSDECNARIGLVLFKALVDAEIIQQSSPRPGEKKKTTCLNPEILRIISEDLGVYLEHKPIWGAMVVPPRSWKKNNDGGYHFDLKGKHKLMRGAGSIFCAENVPEVFAAVNTLQKTAFHINRNVLGVATDIFENPRPEELHKLFALSPFLEEVPRRFLLVSIASILAEAQRLKEFPAIYYTGFLDFRGRYYYKSTRLNPQGSNLCRALHQFAKEKPIDCDGAANWLARHGASCYGGEVGRGTYDEREKWVKHNEDKITALATEPLLDKNRDFLMTASKPWLFLAWCFEWAGFIREGKGFKSTLPVAVDGTCNGIQHFAALMRSRQLAEKVNLIPSERPGDIYAFVAEESRKKLLSRNKAMTWYNILPLDKLIQKYDEYGYRLNKLRRKKKNVTHLSDDESSNEVLPEEPDNFAENMAKGDFEEQSDVSSAREEDEETCTALKNVESVIQDDRNSLSPNKCIEHLQECRRQLTECVLLYECPENIKKPEFTRSLIKSIVMTFPYSATHRGNVRGLEDEFDKNYKPYIDWLAQVKPKDVIPAYYKPKDIIANPIVRISRGIIQEAMPDAVCIMQYLKGLLPDDKKKPKVSWVSPVGLTVNQFYAAPEKSNTIYLEYSDLSISLQKYGRGRKAALKKHNSAISPNFVHSCDAAHMMKTVNASRSEGVDSFLMVHDSFATHAADMEKLSKILRDEFVKMYTDQNPLEILASALRVNMEQSIKKKKKKVKVEKIVFGDFDIRQVMEAEYFFS